MPTKYNNMLTTLKIWIGLNIMISFYELYVILIRRRIIPQHCKTNFWSESTSLPIFQEYWNEYACKVDWRYFKTNSYVYIIEFINVLTTLGLILFYGTPYIKPILTIQMLNCLGYFATLERIPDINPQNILYLIISAIWIIIPGILLTSM